MWKVGVMEQRELKSTYQSGNLNNFGFISRISYWGVLSAIMYCKQYLRDLGSPLDLNHFPSILHLFLFSSSVLCAGCTTSLSPSPFPLMVLCDLDVVVPNQNQSISRIIFRTLVTLILYLMV